MPFGSSPLSVGLCSAWTSENPHLQNQVLDIEDLMVMGREQHMCPYFYSRDRMADAELVLLPYNYLIDTSIRNRLGLQFDNAILIFDEAHNLEGVCGDSASFDLSEADLAQAIQEVQRCIDMLRDPQSTAVEEMAAASGGAVDAPDLPSLAILKAILLEFEQLLDRQPLPDNGDGFTQPGEFIFQLLRQCKVRRMQLHIGRGEQTQLPSPMCWPLNARFFLCVYVCASNSDRVCQQRHVVGSAGQECAAAVLGSRRFAAESVCTRQVCNGDQSRLSK